MVKKDLARAGIPYETPDGIADFHAARRHTQITDLLRNGATLPEAKELARHTDVKMTMRYIHIGIDDQAKAVQALKCQWIGSDSAVSDRLSPSQPVAECPNDLEAQKRQNPCGDRGSDVHCPNLSPDVSGDCQWRRRESNPRPVTFPRLHLRAYSNAFTLSPREPASTRSSQG